MSPAELPPEPDEPPAHAAEHVAPHAVPRVSAHRTMELDTVKVADPALNARNAPTQRGLRPPVIPPGYRPEGDAGYVVDEVSQPPTTKPWLLIGGAGLVLVVLGVGAVFALTRGGAAEPAATSSARAATDEPPKSADAVEPPAASPPEASAQAPEGQGREAEEAPQPAVPEAPSAHTAPTPSAPVAKPPTAAPPATSRPPASKQPKGKDGKPWEEWM
ncbi:MAG: hypothetical protein R3B89_24000 [Polyangiaceae bacterium]